MGARRRQRWGSVTTLRDDGGGHIVKPGANVCTPSACKTLWSLRRHDDAVLGASQMESQALGFGDGVGGNSREKIQLCIELGHVDRDGGAEALRVCAFGLWAASV